MFSVPLTLDQEQGQIGLCFKKSWICFAFHLHPNHPYFNTSYIVFLTGIAVPPRLWMLPLKFVNYRNLLFFQRSIHSLQWSIQTLFDIILCFPFTECTIHHFLETQRCLQWSQWLVWFVGWIQQRCLVMSFCWSLQDLEDRKKSIKRKSAQKKRLKIFQSKVPECIIRNMLWFG